MDIAHIGPRKSPARPVRRDQHSFLCPQAFMLRRCLNIMENRPHRLFGFPSGIPCGGVADIRLYRMGQGIHAGSRRNRIRQGADDRRVQHRIGRDQREIVNRIFMSCIGIYDNGSKCGLASRSRRCGHCDQKRRFSSGVWRRICIRLLCE